MALWLIHVYPLHNFLKAFMKQRYPRNESGERIASTLFVVSGKNKDIDMKVTSLSEGWELETLQQMVIVSRHST